jgi:DNA-binding response OmpR family regulator
MARVQALLRRGSAIAQTVLTWDGLAIDPRSCQIAYHERLLALTPKEYAILELLLRHPHQPLNSQIILDRVWTALESPAAIARSTPRNSSHSYPHSRRIFTGRSRLLCRNLSRRSAYHRSRELLH